MGDLKYFISGFLMSVFAVVLYDTSAKNIEQTSINEIKQNGAKKKRIEIPFSDEIGFSNEKVEFHTKFVDKDGVTYKHNTHGKVSVVILTTTWCHNCPNIVKAMSTCADKLKGNTKVEFYNVILGKDSLDKVKTHFDSIGVKNFKLFNSLPMTSVTGVDTIPTCLVFDKNGKQVFRFSGDAKYASKKFVKFLEDLSKR